MTFNEALKKSRAYQRSVWPRIVLKYLIPRVGHTEHRTTPQIFWRGREHLTNIDAENFDQYAEDIKTGVLVIGPATYPVGDSYRFLPDHIGLYHNR